MAANSKVGLHMELLDMLSSTRGWLGLAGLPPDPAPIPAEPAGQAAAVRLIGRDDFRRFARNAGTRGTHIPFMAWQCLEDLDRQVGSTEPSASQLQSYGHLCLRFADPGTQESACVEEPSLVEFVGGVNKILDNRADVQPQQLLGFGYGPSTLSFLNRFVAEELHAPTGAAS